MERIPESEWVWYGFAGHLIVSKRCAYHLCTRIGRRLVSTVGAFYPSHNAPMETIGSGPKDYYETVIFSCDGEDEDGDPLVGEEILCTRYADSIQAELGHREACLNVAKGGE